LIEPISRDQPKITRRSSRPTDMPTFRSLIVLAALSAALLVPAPLEARCMPAVGHGLAAIGTSVAPGANVLLELRPVYDRARVTPAPAAVTVRRRGCTTNCDTHIALQPLAVNLFALPIPSALSPGRYQLVELRESIDVAPAAPTTPITSAPRLAATPMSEAMIGTGATAPTIELASLPPGAVGLLARWGSSAWFVRLESGATSAMMGQRRCSTPIAGRSPLAVGDAIEVVLVDANGGTSPATRLTSTTALPL
jgi:hypothetical protein